jgi:hypothetical protein
LPTRLVAGPAWRSARARRLAQVHVEHGQDSGRHDRHGGGVHSRPRHPDLQPRGSAASCLRLLRALAVEMHESWLEAHRYLNMNDLREHKEALRMSACPVDHAGRCPQGPATATKSNLQKIPDTTTSRGASPRPEHRALRYRTTREGPASDHQKGPASEMRPGSAKSRPRRERNGNPTPGTTRPRDAPVAQAHPRVQTAPGAERQPHIRHDASEILRLRGPARPRGNGRGRPDRPRAARPRARRTPAPRRRA